MKKRISGYKLNRDSQARLALLKNLVYALIKHDSIVTTKIKAKAVTPIFEKLLTKAKTDSVQNRRHVQAFIQENTLVKKLFSEIAPKYKNVRGGYTKLTLLGNRKGDNAPTVRLSLTKEAKVASKPTTPHTDEATKVTPKSSPVKAITPETVKATKAAPKLVSRTGKRGDK